MKNKNVILLSLFFITLAFATSCKPDDNNNTPSPSPSVVFTVTSPEAGKAYMQGDTIRIKAKLSFETELHGWELELKNKADNNKEVLKVEEHTHEKTVEIDTFWVNNVTMHSDMELVIYAIKDHEGNKDSKEIHFHCHP